MPREELRADVEDEVKKMVDDFKSFLTHEKQLSQNSVSSYCFDVKSFLNFIFRSKSKKGEEDKSGNTCAKVNIKDIESCDINLFREWVYYRVEEGLSARSNARAISAIKGFYAFLAQDSGARNQEILKLFKPKIPKSLPKVINEEMFAQFCAGIDAVSKKKWRSLRDKSIALLMFTSGLRISEALSVRLSDVAGGRDFLRIIGKGGKERITPYIDQVRNLVDQYIEQSPFELKDGYLFVSNTGKKCSSRLVQRVFENARRVANLPEYVTPHKLRHSCATILLENSRDENALKKIKDLLGHSNLATTEIYTKVSSRMITDALTDINYWES